MKRILKEKLPNSKLCLLIFFVLISAVAFANGLSDAVISNYFKDAYDVDTSQRAFLEFPRELPGVVCVFVIAGLSFLGDIRIAFIAQILACFGIMVLGIWEPPFALMTIFLFIYSLGQHIFMPLQDAIGMNLSEKDQLGKRIGQFGSVKTAFGFLAGILAFLGFRFKWFSFKSDIKLIFVISAISFFIAMILAFSLIKATSNHGEYNAFCKRKKMKMLFRKEYTSYYILTILNGVQKQIALVYGSWVIIDLLLKGADIMSILTIGASFLGIFFFRYVGKWIDSKGIRFMMHIDALSFIFVYVIYGFIVWGLTVNFFDDIGFAAILVYVMFILDRLSMQVGVVKSVYLKSIALSDEDVTATLSTGISLDHIVSIIAAQVCAVVWKFCGAQWVFFIAAFLSLGNLYIAHRLPKDK